MPSLNSWKISLQVLSKNDLTVSLKFKKMTAMVIEIDIRDRLEADFWKEEKNTWVFKLWNPEKNNED